MKEYTRFMTLKGDGVPATDKKLYAVLRPESGPYMGYENISLLGRTLRVRSGTYASIMEFIRGASDTDVELLYRKSPGVGVYLWFVRTDTASGPQFVGTVIDNLKEAKA